MKAGLVAVLAPVLAQQDIVHFAKPTADLDAKWGTGFMKGDSFVGLAYDSLK